MRLSLAIHTRNGLKLEEKENKEDLLSGDPKTVILLLIPRLLEINRNLNKHITQLHYTSHQTHNDILLEHKISLARYG